MKRSEMKKSAVILSYFSLVVSVFALGAALFVSCRAHAESESKAIGSGVIIFTGKIVNSPCIVDIADMETRCYNENKGRDEITKIEFNDKGEISLSDKGKLIREEINTNTYLYKLYVD